MIKPHDIDANNHLISCFGKWEMEAAARKIILLAQEANGWNMPLTSRSFDSEEEKEGFDDFEYYGWLTKNENSYFIKESFVRRLEDYFNKNLPTQK